MLKIFIITNFYEEPDKTCNSRFSNIAEMFSENGFKVEILTSTFDHMNKKQKNIIDYEQNGYLVKHFYEKGYPKNICLKRFFSHAQYAKNISNYLNKSDKPDCIYLAVPSLKVGEKVAKYCNKNNVKLIIDVQDLWPEAFKTVFNPPLIGSLVYMPFQKQAKLIYLQADCVIGVSETYVNAALKENKKCKKGICVYLGTDLVKFDTASNGVTRSANENLTLVYIGTLGQSYSIDKIIAALAEVNSKGMKTNFVILGDGPNRKYLESIAKKEKVNCQFKGYLNYSEMVKLLVACDIAVNPIIDGAAQSIINKVGDYAAAGLPVINTQTCEEYRNQVNQRKLGVNCSNNDKESIVNAIMQLSDSSLRNLCGENNRKWAETDFDRSVTYSKIVEAVKDLFR